MNALGKGMYPLFPTLPATDVLKKWWKVRNTLQLKSVTTVVKQFGEIQSIYTYKFTTYLIIYEVLPRRFVELKAQNFLFKKENINRKVEIDGIGFQYHFQLSFIFSTSTKMDVRMT